MSSDFGFLKSGAADPEQVFGGLAEGETSGLASSVDVLRFRQELLDRRRI
jgi:hypothetical protein